MENLWQQLITTWASGGWVMPALAFLALVLYTSAAHLLVTLYHRGLTRATDSTLKGWVARPSQAPRQLQELIRYTQDEASSLADLEGRFREVEASKVLDVDRRLAFVNVLVVSAPLFGLLGTVMGMLLTFRAIGIGGSSTSEIIAKGISEALVATQTGMLVAIPGLMMAHLAKRWRVEYVGFLARLETVSLRHFRPQFRGMTREFVRPAGTTVTAATHAQPAAA